MEITLSTEIDHLTPKGEIRLEPRMTSRAQTALVGARDKRPPRLEAGRQVNPDSSLWNWNADITKRRASGRDKEALALLKLLRDFDPQMSQGVWNFTRLLNPGHDLKAYVTLADGSEEAEDGAAQIALDELAQRVGREYGGGLDQLHDVLALLVLTTGAVAGEVAPDASGTAVEDWYPIDPALLTFKRIRVEGEQFADGSAKTMLKLGQVDSQGVWHEVPEEQVFYQPLDPDVDDPYGRPPLMAAMQTVIAKAQLLIDIRAVAHNQGFPRLDVKVLWEQLLKRAPADLVQSGDDSQMEEWAAKQLRAIATDYEDLKVDDTFVHFDFVEVGMVEGTGGGGVGGGFDFAALELILTNQLNSALKQLAIMTGQGTGSNETHGSVQWNIQVLSVRALRRLVKRIIERYANASLQILGIPARAKMEYDDLRTTDRLYEAQAEVLEGKSLEADVKMGWRDNDEAAEMRTGHKAVEEPQYVKDAELAAKQAEEAAALAGQVGPGAPVGELRPGSEQESIIACMNRTPAARS